METEITLPEHVRERLEELERELEHSIYVATTMRQAGPCEIVIHTYRCPRSDFTITSRLLHLEPGAEAVNIYDCITCEPVEDCGVYTPEGELAGEIAPHTVYNFLALQRSWFPEASAELLDAVLYEPIRRCVESAFIAETDQRRIAETRAAVERFAASLYDRQLIERREMIAADEREIVSYGDYLAEKYRTIREHQRMLDALLHVQRNNGAERLVQEFDLLAEHSRIASLDFGNEHITLTTIDDFRLRNPETDESRWLGAFRVTINPATGSVHIANLNTPRGGRDHPHVIGNRPCFGGHEQAFADLLAKGELYTLFELLVQYLETFNPDDDWGRHAAYWFDVPDERPVGAQEELAV